MRSTPAACGAAAALSGLCLVLAGCRGVLPSAPARQPTDIQYVIMGGPDGRADWACFRCHGLEGAGDGGGSPRLAGLPAGYLEKQLLDYARDVRPDPVMSPIARMLDEAQRRALARWYEALPAPRAGPPSAPDPRGERLYWRGDTQRGLAPCATCHGPPWTGGGPAFPPLAGQPAPYVVTQMERWRRGVRRNDPRDVMVAQARALTPGEVRALADYLAAAAPAPATGSSG